MSTPEPIEVQVRYSFWDLVLMPSFAYRPLVPPLTLLAAVLAAVLLGQRLLPDPAPWGLVLGGLLCPLALLGLVGFFFWTAYLQWRAAGGLAGEPLLCRLTSAGIRLGSPPDEEHFKWADFRQVVETSRFFHFALPSGRTFLIPRRCFPGQGQQESFRSLLREQLGQRAVLR